MTDDEFWGVVEAVTFVIFLLMLTRLIVKLLG